MARGASSTPSAKELRRELRQRQTDAEGILWEHLRNRQLAGKKFRRQHSFGPFIVDFYCHEHSLVIEVDGSIHNTLESRVNDAERESILRDMGLVILRFSNDEVMRNTDRVINDIKLTLYKKAPLPQGKGAGGEGDYVQYKIGALGKRLAHSL